MNILKFVKLGTLSIVVFTTAFFIAGCNKKDTSRTKQRPAYEVEVALPLNRAIEIWDKYIARIEGEKSVEIRARVNGYLEKICFKDGDYVKEGQLLFIIDPRPFQATVDAMAATVEEIESQLELAEANLSRARNLISTNAVSGEILETRISSAKSAKARLALAKANLRQAELDLEFTKIRAPIPGYMGRRNVDEGNLISPSENLLGELVSRDVVYAYFDVSERDTIRYVKMGLIENIDSDEKSGPPVRIKLFRETAPSASGHLNFISNKLESANLEFRASIDNSSGRLFPGMLAEAELMAGKPESKLLIPETAISTDLAGRYVLTVDKDNTVKYKVVVVGELVDNMRVIEAGLQADDMVVINGLQRAVVDSKVKPILRELK